jgi:hypothetical protein
MIAIAFSKSGSDCHVKIDQRFSSRNRDPISRSVCTWGPKTGFQSRSNLQMKIADRFYRENRDPVAKCGNCPGSSRKRVSEYPLNENRLLIFSERSSIAMVIAIAFSKSGPDCETMLF